MRVTENGPTDLEQLLTEEVVRALDVDEQTLAAAVRAETAAQDARTSRTAVNPAAIRTMAVDEAKPAGPLAPNLLADTKKFATLCGGSTNTMTEIMAAHNGSSWRAARPSVSAASRGSLEVVTLPNLPGKGIAFGGDLALAALGPSRNWLGSDFRVALLDVTINEHPGTNDVGREDLIVLAQDRDASLFTGLRRGGFRTQASCLVNVVRHSGDITFHIADRIMENPLIAGAGMAGGGWKYLHKASTGWADAPHRCLFRGSGSIRVALALPYIGTGDHGGAFIYAQSIGRYTHGDDRLPAGVNF